MEKLEFPFQGINEVFGCCGGSVSKVAMHTPGPLGHDRSNRSIQALPVLKCEVAKLSVASFPFGLGTASEKNCNEMGFCGSFWGVAL
jgi:hypothetical protein